MAELRCIKGLDEFARALDQLPRNIGRNVLRGAVNAGATVLRQQAVVFAPVYEGDDPRPDPGRIRRAIYQKQIPERSNELLQVFYVGVRRGRKNQIKVVRGKVTNLDAYYWTWLEFGHAYVPPRPKGMSMKAHRAAVKASGTAIWVEPRSFMRPAFAIAKDQAVQAMIDYLATRIPKEAASLGLTMK
ncbi:HK97 gp10 family phage protein [Burkholderia multivorans]|uniref:HK97-gp10 family putative phage morphogenesis protein n=1 Tax=Burkholderia multivorans TaxID=87883 RepID=UPI001C223AF4|nr:HK97 gp10 family phage protein [Burkholderia multivorans]MCA8248077.1 HK97 gp10 family phage protein [Burkholderia multivorans]